MNLSWEYQCRRRKRRPNVYLKRNRQRVLVSFSWLFKENYIAKRGQNSLTSRDGSVKIKPNGGLYDGVDLKVEHPKFPEIPEIPKNLLEINKRLTVYSDQIWVKDCYCLTYIILFLPTKRFRHGRMLDWQLGN